MISFHWYNLFEQCIVFYYFVLFWLMIGIFLGDDLLVVVESVRTIHCFVLFCIVLGDDWYCFG